MGQQVKNTKPFFPRVMTVLSPESRSLFVILMERRPIMLQSTLYILYISCSGIQFIICCSLIAVTVHVSSLFRKVQKKNEKKNNFYRPTDPIFLKVVTGNGIFFFGLIVDYNMNPICVDLTFHIFAAL